MQVQTNGRKTPIAAVQDSLKDLEGEVQDIRQQFMHAVGAGLGGAGADVVQRHGTHPWACAVMQCKQTPCQPEPYDLSLRRLLMWLPALNRAMLAGAAV